MSRDDCKTSLGALSICAYSRTRFAILDAPHIPQWGWSLAQAWLGCYSILCTSSQRDVASGQRKGEYTPRSAALSPSLQQECCQDQPCRPCVLCYGCPSPTHSAERQFQGIVMKSSSGVRSIMWNWARRWAQVQLSSAWAERSWTEGSWVETLMPEAARRNGVQQPRQQHGGTWTITLSGVCLSLFFVVLCSGTGELAVGTAGIFVLRATWTQPMGSHLVFVPAATENRVELSSLHPLCVKKLFCVHIFVINMAAVTMCFLVHCFLIAVNCFLNPQSLPLSFFWPEGVERKGSGLFGFWFLTGV